MGELIYGEIADLTPISASSCFIIVLVVLILLQMLFAYLEDEAEKHEWMGLFEKLRNELMILGLISFIIFLLQNTDDSAILDSSWYAGLDFAHIIILFVAVAFMGQAAFLVHFASSRGKRYLKSVRTSCGELLEKSADEKYLQQYRKSPNIFAVDELQELIDDIEFKIMGELFLTHHKLPEVFNFAVYVGHLFNNYITELGEASVTSWFLMAVLVCINLIRCEFIDPSASEKICDGETATGTTCAEYILAYSLVCGAILNIFLFGVYWASKRYLDAITLEGLKTVFNIQVDSLGQHSERLQLIIPCLKTMQEKYEVEEASEQVTSGDLPTTKKNATSLPEAAGDGIVTSPFRAEESSAEPDHNPDSPSSGAAPRRVMTRKESVYQLASMRENQKLQESLLVHRQEEMMTMSIGDRLKVCLEEVYNRFLKSDPSQLAHIFWLRQPALFFLAVEFGFLLQCFYVAISTTQLVPLALEVDGSVGWIVALVVPFLIGFLQTRLLLPKAVMLRSVIWLDKVSWRVCEETLEEQAAVDDICGRMLKELDSVKSAEDKVALVKRYFNAMDHDSSGALDKVEFRRFLGSMQVYLSKRRFDLVWQCIDYDLSEEVTWDEVFSFLFPADKAALKEELHIVDLLREKFAALCLAEGVPASQHSQRLRALFNKYDEDRSGAIEKGELKAMMKDLNLQISRKAFGLLFGSLDLDSGGTIEWTEFHALFLPGVYWAIHLSLLLCLISGYEGSVTVCLQWADNADWWVEAEGSDESMDRPRLRWAMLACVLSGRWDQSSEISPRE